MKKMLAVLGILALMAGASFGGSATWHKLPIESKADLGANYVLTVDYSCFTNTSTNAPTQSFTVPVASKTYVELVCMVLQTAFVDNATNAHNSLTMTVGDTSDADILLTSTELNSNGTEVYLAFPRASADTLSTTAKVYTNVTAVSQNATTLNYAGTNAISMSLEGVTLTNMVWDAGATTGTVYVVTNATATPTAGLIQVVTNVATATTDVQTNLIASSLSSATYGQKVYTSNDTLTATFTGTTTYALTDLDAGEVKLYFRVQDATATTY